MEFNETRKQLVQQGNSLMNSIRSLLDKSKKVSSGKLRDSLNTNYELSPTEIIFNLKGSSHWKFIDKGVDGAVKKYGSPYSRGDKMPPLVEVRSWMDIKGIGLGAENLYKTFAMQKSWHNKGIKPTFIFTKEIEKFKKKSTPILAQAFLTDTLNAIRNGNNSSD